MTTNQWYHDRVVYRDSDYTEMEIAPKGRAKMLAAKLLKAGKAFEVQPNDDGSWTFTIREHNHPNNWEDAV